MSLNSNDNYSYCSPGFIDQDNSSGTIEDEWRTEKENILRLRDIEHLGSSNYSKNAKEIRDSFKGYFNPEGEVEWQWDIISRTA